MTKPSLSLERRFRQQGLALIAGIDEAGRGAWAGPVVAAAVILPLECPDLRAALKGVNDSKKLTARQREKFFSAIREVAVAVGVGGVGPGEVQKTPRKESIISGRAVFRSRTSTTR